MRRACILSFGWDQTERPKCLPYFFRISNEKEIMLSVSAILLVCLFSVSSRYVNGVVPWVERYMVLLYQIDTNRLDKIQ